MTQDAAFACCSAGIGRWFWVAWASESDARALAPALASGYREERRRGREEGRRVGRPRDEAPAREVGLRLQATRGPRGPHRGGSRDRGQAQESAEPPGRHRPGKEPGQTRLAFLYSASEGDRPGEVAVARHRIVRQNPRKIHVDREPFREEEWARREEGGPDAPKPRTLAVDRDTLRTRGAGPPSRFVLLRQRGGRHPGCPCGPDGEARLVRRPRREVPLLGGVRQGRLPTARPDDPPGRRRRPRRIPGGGAGLSRGPRLLRTHRRRNSPPRTRMIEGTPDGQT